MSGNQRELSEEEIAKILNAFPNSSFIKDNFTYHLGFSGLPVIAATYEPTSAFAKQKKRGLNGTYIVKIGDIEWAKNVEDFFNSLTRSEAKNPLIVPYQMISDPVSEFRAIAYEIAFSSILKPQTLFYMLEQRNKGVAEVQKQIEELSRSLATWYLKSTTTPSKMDGVKELIIHLLTEKRTKRLIDTLEVVLPSLAPDDPQINISGHDRNLPNPLAYIQGDLLKRHKAYSPPCHFMRIHGDLHSGNIICYPKETSEVENSPISQKPRLIDFDQSTTAGSPFFDLAYLEFDIIRHTLNFHTPDGRKKFLILLDYSMSTITGEEDNKKVNQWDAENTWKFTLPLRQVVQRLLKATRKDTELIWWAATVAVGLNYAQKGEASHALYERKAGLIYAAFGLLKVLGILDPDKRVTGGISQIIWLEEEARYTSKSDSTPSSSPLPPSPESERERANSHPLMGSQISLNDYSDPSGEEQKYQQIKKSTLASGQSLIEKLTEIINKFNKSRPVLQENIPPVVSALKELERFLDNLSEIAATYNHPTSYRLKKARKRLEQLLSLLNDFRDSCHPRPTRDIPKAEYNKELRTITTNLAAILTDLNKLLGQL